VIAYVLNQLQTIAPLPNTPIWISPTLSANRLSQLENCSKTPLLLLSDISGIVDGCFLAREIEAQV
jgi:hypothetical protein